MTTVTDKKDANLIKKLIGNQFETHEDLKNELVRRSAVLDFLALYQEAKKDGVVERVKHIVHAKDFLNFKPQHLEIYITRLLGRCLRSHCDGPQTVEKERNSFKYKLNIRYTHPHMTKIFEMQDLVQLNWPWYIHRYYRYGIRDNPMQRYQENPQLYWRTRGLVDPTCVDAMYASWNQFYARVDTLERVVMNKGLHIHYGNPGYIGRNRWYRPYNNPSYHSYEAYKDFKEWMKMADEFLENDHTFNTFRLLSDHDQSDDSNIEKMLRENEEREAEFLRERAREMAAQRQRDNSIDYPLEQEYEPPEVEEGTTGQTLADRLFATLREKGLVQ